MSEKQEPNKYYQALWAEALKMMGGNKLTDPEANFILGVRYGLREKATETRNILVDKLVKDYAVKSGEIAECVELYYDAQKLRIMHSNKDRSEGPGELVLWLEKWLETGERVIKNKLETWVRGPDSPDEAKWAFQQWGIGPIIASGLAAYIDPRKCDTPSALWKYAGQAPGFDRPVKGVKLPYNARLKTLIWKLGQSFIKVSGKEDALYGQLFQKFKAEEVSRNESGFYKAAAAHELATKRFDKDSVTKARLLEGKLSDGHLNARAQRRACKIFLVHYYVVARTARGLPIRKPYVQEHLGHDGIIGPPYPNKPDERSEPGADESNPK